MAKAPQATDVAFRLTHALMAAGTDVTHVMVILGTANSMDIGLAGPIETADRMVGAMEAVRAYVDAQPGKRSVTTQTEVIHPDGTPITRGDN